LGRRLSTDRQAAIVADLIIRLGPILTEAAKGSQAEVRTIAVLLANASAPAGADISSTAAAATLIEASHELVTVQTSAAMPEALTTWITRYFGPASPHRLSGAAGLWTRAVNLQRDRQRRAKVHPADGCPTRLTLSAQHRELLGKQVGHPGRETAAMLVGKLIEREYRQRPVKKKMPSDPQPLIDPQSAFDL
jgi:hypothetical protein